jgi:Histidine kinase-, DNA gyrase B-, and HSP90-like ATPase
MSSGPNEESLEQLDLTPSPRLLEILGEIPYQPWQCVAELIDNSFDEFMAETNRDLSDTPIVRVTLPKQNTDDGDEIVCVADNGRGMGKEVLERSLQAGYSSNARYGSLGLFGMGFNIATARLGTVTEVRTTRAGDPDWLIAEIDFRRMHRERSFGVPLRREPKDDLSLHGTEVTVRRLKQEIRERLRRQATASQIRERLGNVYSYMLRQKDGLPELPGPMLGGKAYALYVNDTRVQPRLPCVWSVSRSVDYRGTEIPAVLEISRELKPAWACMTCGHWHHIAVEECVECGSDNLELRERQITGWIGVQRYLDNNDFGIDLLRNGRKILVSDKTLFDWENPDTGQAWTEYPIEFGSTSGGRIVGEIHLDHVPVVYQKNDFERGSNDWLVAVEAIRGEGPLQPKKFRHLGYGENRSPLGQIFNAYRRNDPGRKCLIPGNDKGPIHGLTREWAQRFRKGQADYLSDDRWYEAVEYYDRVQSGQIKPQQPTGSGSGPAPDGDGLPDDDVLSRTGLGDDRTPSPQSSPANEQPVPETDDERFARYKASARPVLDLCNEIGLAHLPRREVRVYETDQPLLDADGRSTPCTSRTLRGNKVEIFVHSGHEVFNECGRETREYAIMELAEVLRTQARGTDGIVRVAADITSRLPDQRFTDAVLRQRAEAVVGRAREALAPIAAEHAAVLWAGLPIVEKEAAERNAGAVDPRLSWPDATADGRFAAHIGPGALATMVRARPDLVLDGSVFTTAWSTWTTDEARGRQVERLARRIEAVAEFLASTEAKSRLELAMTRLILDMLDQEVRWEEPA